MPSNRLKNAAGHGKPLMREGNTPLRRADEDDVEGHAKPLMREGIAKPLAREGHGPLLRADEDDVEGHSLRRKGE